jgi:hypothetical protein
MNIKRSKHPPPKIIDIKSSDYWFKIVEFLHQNWALIDEQEDGTVKVFFISDISSVFDELEFDSVKDAEKGLKTNDFGRYADDKEAQKFIPSPQRPFRQSELYRNSIYSSGRYWK